MRWLLLLLAACDSSTVAPCQECGPGAITAGARYGFYSRFEANAGGTVVRGYSDRVYWLDDDLHAARASSTFAPDLRSPQAGAVAVDDDGAASAIAYELDVATQTFPAVLAHFGADGTLAWTQSAGDLASIHLAANRDVVVASFGGAAVEAFGAGDGALRWSKPAPNLSGLAVDDAGDVVFSGWFVGAVDFGDDITATTQAVSSGYVVEVGRDGVTRWIVTLDPVDASGNARVLDVAYGPGTGVAIAAEYIASDATLLGNVFPRAEYGQIAVISADGTHLVWNRASQGALGSLDTIVSDATNVLVSGGYEGMTDLDPDAPYADEMDAFIASFSPTGIDWVRTGNGYGHERARLYSPTVASFEIDQGDYDESDDANESLDYGDVHIDGNGVAITRLAP